MQHSLANANSTQGLPFPLCALLLAAAPCCSQRTKACRGFTQHSLPSMHNSRLWPCWDQGSLSGTWGKEIAGRGVQL